MQSILKIFLTTPYKHTHSPDRIRQYQIDRINLLVWFRLTFLLVIYQQIKSLSASPHMWPCSLQQTPPSSSAQIPLGWQSSHLFGQQCLLFGRELYKPVAFTDISGHTVYNKATQYSAIG